jgi:hypothetical protein
MQKVIVIMALAVLAAEAAIAGTITGVVTNDSNGQPISGMWVYACDYTTGQYCGGNNTNSDGFYSITGLAEGTYKVGVWVSGSQYALEYYDNQISWDTATPVTVPAAGVVQNINFSLELGASISGVVKNSSGVGQANVQVDCWADNGYGTGTQTEADGFYRCDGLPVGYNYNVVAYPSSDSNYMITGITVDVYQPGEYTDEDIVLGDGGLKISGRVTDKATALPLADVRVGLWNDDFEIWIETRTDVNGMYLLANLPPGVVDVSVEPDSYYAYMGIDELELEEDINNLDFALPAGAILSGRVLGAKTAKPLAGVEIEYSSEETSAYKSQFTDADGSFCLTQLPPGIAEVKAKPNVDRGCAWNLPWGSDLVCLDEGENRSGRIITLEKGALVRGYIKDADGNAISGVEYGYMGRKCDGWGETDVNGFYQIRLPLGTYCIAPDDDELGALPAIVTITDVNEEVDVPDMIVYTEETGGQISGEVNNPGEYAKTGYFVVLAFQAGTVLNDPNAWYTVQPVVVTGMENASPFSLSKLPPGVNYDIYLCVDNQADIESIAVRDSALNVAVGTTGIILDYNSQGSTVRGALKNADDRPVLGATVLLSDSSGGFAGFGDADCNGEYVIYNVPAGTYTATAVHSKYLPISTTVEVVEGVPADVNTIIMPFRGEKEGPDLNGDGNVDMIDVAEFAEQWLNSGTSESDFNQDNKVNFSDWVRIAENWMSRAIWLHE